MPGSHGSTARDKTRQSFRAYPTPYPTVPTAHAASVEVARALSPASLYCGPVSYWFPTTTVRSLRARFRIQLYYSIGEYT